MDNIRSISLLNSDYKIYSSVLANRLRSTIYTLVHKDQIGYAPGRNIMDSIFTHYLLSKHGTLNNTLQLFVDFAKACNSINHSYILKTLSCYGFPPLLVAHITSLFLQAKSKILVNGLLLSPVQIKTGVTQGDPIAGYLFILAIEPLLRHICQSPHILPIVFLYPIQMVRVLDWQPSHY